MSLTNEIILRPRFKFSVKGKPELLLKGFENEKHTQHNILVKCLDEHVFLKFPKKKQHSWSPQLHLEFQEHNENETTIYGVFGPNPTFWTFFMFLHFVVAGFFIAFGIWTYTNASLDASYSIPLFLCMLMLLLWFVLYFIGRIGKSKGTPEMYELHRFMRDTLRHYREL